MVVIARPKRELNSDVRKINKMKKNSDFTIASTIGIMTASFYICWTPYAIRCILSMFGVDLPAVVSGVTILFAKFGIVINPLVYIFYNNEVDKLLRPFQIFI